MFVYFLETEVYYDWFTVRHNNKCKDNKRCEEFSTKWVNFVYRTLLDESHLTKEMCETAEEDAFEILKFIRKHPYNENEFKGSFCNEQVSVLDF